MPNRKNEDMSNMDTRIIHIESRVDNLERTVSEIKEGVSTLLKRPTNPGFGQFMGVVLTVLAASAIVFGFAEWRLSQAVTPVNRDIAKLEQKIEQSELYITQSRINDAVMEERTSWMRSQTGWTATIEKKN